MPALYAPRIPSCASRPSSASYDVELCQETSPLCPGAAPISVANFLAYVDGDLYPPTSVIHRRGAGPPSPSPLVIQGGGYYIGEKDGSPFSYSVMTLDPIDLEVGVGLSNVRGSIAMARGAATNSATSQWFINLVDNVNLDTAGGGYAVFGNVADEASMDVVAAIGALPIYNGGGVYAELPLVDYPGGVPAYLYMVYVSSVERVPEPGAALASALALGALALLRQRRA